MPKATIYEIQRLLLMDAEHRAEFEAIPAKSRKRWDGSRVFVTTITKRRLWIVFTVRCCRHSISSERVFVIPAGEGCEIARDCWTPIRLSLLLCGRKIDIPQDEQ